MDIIQHSMSERLDGKELHESLSSLIEDGFGDSHIVVWNRYLNDSMYYKNSENILFIGVDKIYDMDVEKSLNKR